MSLLDNLPDRCTIRRTIRQRDALGSTKLSVVVEQEDVECWEQPASATQVREFERRGINATSKIYFKEDPNVTERHEILITSRRGTTIDEPTPLAVKAKPRPDASIGFGILFFVMVDDLSEPD